jgi:glycosyltransferase involved in cell wall biosynthesis
LVIGWAGSPVHVKDLEIMAGFLKVIHDKYPHTHFAICGMPREEVFEKFTEGEDKKITVERETRTENLDFHKNVARWFSGFDPTRLDLFFRSDISEYGKFYSMFDINLAYTRDDIFSRCKSEIKVIEGLAYGAVPVFSYMGGYKDYFDSLPEKEWAFAVQVDGKEAWVRKLSTIVEDFFKYKEIAIELGKKAREDYSIEKVTERRLAVYETLLK